MMPLLAFIGTFSMMPVSLLAVYPGEGNRLRKDKTVLQSLFRPDLHVVLVHYPIALATLGLAIELFSIFWRRSSFRTAGRWMILLGTLLCLPALTTGLYAAYQALGGDVGMSWHQIQSGSDFDEQKWELLRDHLILTAGGTGLMLVVVIVWLASSDAWRRRLHVVHLLALLLGVVALAFGADHGGQMRYHGVGSIKPDAPAPTTSQDDSLPMQEKIRILIPPIQVHLILAGLTVATSLAAIGLSFRKLGEARRIERDYDTDIADALTAHSLDPGAAPARLPPEEPESSVPAARFWALGALLALTTIASGWWMFFDGAWDFNVMRDYVRDPEHQRVFFHVVFGASLVILPLILALFTRFAPRARIFLWILTLCMIAVLAAQIWLGVLLMFDTNVGPINAWNVPGQ